MTKTAKHPALDFAITFDSTRHTYTDNEGSRYTSGTALEKRAFPEFDAQAAAERVAARDGLSVAAVLATWKAKADESVERGNRIHAYAEARSIGVVVPVPENEGEARAFAIVDKALAGLAGSGYEFIAAEQIVFDPLFLVAGQIDLVMRAPSRALAILDWKSCEDITDDAWGRVAFPPISHVPDSKLMHYALQLSTYAWMLTDPEYSNYPSAGEPVELALIHVPHVGDDPVWRPVPYLHDEVSALMLRRPRRDLGGAA